MVTSAGDPGSSRKGIVKGVEVRGIKLCGVLLGHLCGSAEAELGWNFFAF